MKNQYPKFAFIVLLSFLLSSVYAQKEDFSIQDAIGGYHLYPKSLRQLSWVDDQHYSHLSQDDPGKIEIHLIGAIDFTTVSMEDIQSGLSAFNPDLDSLKRFPNITWMDGNTFRFSHKETIYSYQVNDKKVKSLVKSSRSMENSDYHKASHKIAYTTDDNLYIQEGEKSTQITNDAREGIVYGKAVHRYEFGIRKGTFWSPNASKLAFYRKDETMVTQYPLYRLSDTPATAKMVYYPTAGDKSHHVKLGVYDLESGKTVYMQTKGPKEQYLTNISWGPESKYIYIAEVNRGQNHMWLNQYDANTGAFVKTLFEERNERYVEPEHSMIFMEGNKDQFVWWSERDGWNHLYLYNTSGKLIKQLTKGEWIVTSFHGWSKDESQFYISSTAVNGIERHVYCVDAASGKMKKLTKDPGMHGCKMNPSLTHFIDRYTNTVNPGEIKIVNSKGKVYNKVYQAKNPLEGYNLGEMTIGTLKADDGTDLYYRLFKPTNFDESKKYPVVVYLYNGPHAQMVTNSWNGGANHWYHYMAQKGFVVFTIDGRGSSNRGFEFESAVHRQMGTLEMNDQMKGVEFLKGKNWVDSTRMGIHGWSYGGFMTTSMMSRMPGVFKVGVAGGPVIDWNYYEIMYTERYMDSPQENPEGYKNNCLFNYIDQLEGKLLMIHGSQDATVLWQHSLLYLQKAIQKGVQLDYFVYPHHEHNVRGPERVHLYEKISNYFIDNL